MHTMDNAEWCAGYLTCHVSVSIQAYVMFTGVGIILGLVLIACTWGLHIYHDAV